MKKKLFILCSNHSSSLNKKAFNELVEHFRGEPWMLPEGVFLPFVEDVSRSLHEMPKEIKDLYALIKRTDTVVFVGPEHNSCFSAYFKNIIDWLSLIDRSYLSNKVVVLVSASRTTKDVRDISVVGRLVFNALGCDNYHFVNWNKFDLEDMSVEDRLNKREDVFNYIESIDA